ncbi:hypothetical protein [Gimesia aquarii]|uniref:hypothetical protein n=1 Tax=Gimesia aquarii TaxID=2527964 RepID=UPI0011A6D4F4|nr:hypothetical protein [Gimesia aquarii]
MEKEYSTESNNLGINPGFVIGQLTKALKTYEEHSDAKTRQRAQAKIEKWLQVFEGIMLGGNEVGSRTPVSGIPQWATLEVVTGGFATGNLLAGGEIREHELKLLSDFSLTSDGNPRQTLNQFFLTDNGVSHLQEILATGRFEVEVPEEGALLVVAWLLGQGHSQAARELLEVIGPYFSKLRFYPIPTDQPCRFGSRVYLQDVESTLENLNKIRPNPRILAQLEAITIWAPLYDKTVSLFLETVEGVPPFLNEDQALLGGWPCQTFPTGWEERAQNLLDEYVEKRCVHQLCGKPERKKENFSQLRFYLQQYLDDSNLIDERAVKRIRLLLARYISRRGTPDSSICQEARERQVSQANGANYFELSRVVISRLEKYPLKSGIEDLFPVTDLINEQESQQFGPPVSTMIPVFLLRKIERCCVESIEILVRNGVIKSGETLAQVLPQITSDLRAAGITDPQLQQLYASIYRAFRRRRSLLLLNLEHQVQIEELPWVSVVDQFRHDNLPSQELATQTLREVSALTLLSFPHVIIPNKLLQELKALAKVSQLNLPLVNEIAADIFMGDFSNQFNKAAKQSAEMLSGTLYELYYGIDFKSVSKIFERQESDYKRFGRTPKISFAKLCEIRAGVEYGGWNVAVNGMIIEQQQILTTQNLAVLFQNLNLMNELKDRLLSMARGCFTWISTRLQQKSPSWHASLITFKNTAYAWRQMVFYLSLVSENDLLFFLDWAQDYLSQQPSVFQSQFHPALLGLQLAASEKSIESDRNARRFLGWTNGRHWLFGPEGSR